MLTAQKMKFSIKEFFSKCDQIRSFHKKSKNIKFSSVASSSKGKSLLEGEGWGVGGGVGGGRRKRVQFALFLKLL